MVKTKSKLSPVSEDARSVYRKEKVSEERKNDREERRGKRVTEERDRVMVFMEERR